MLREQENRELMQVGAGTPMGELLRHYWHPIAAVAELDDHPTKAVRLLGEDLVLYRDQRGTYGLLDRHCPHRRADLSYGFVEDGGLRCNYHGWLFDEDGRCIEQPYEETAHPEANFKDRVHTRAYSARAQAGLIWAYLGPDPAPPLPLWEPFTWQNGFVQIVFSEVPCNWFQCQENSIDPVHFEWLHTNWSRVLKDQRDSPKPPTHLRVAFDEFEYGFVYRRIMEGQAEEDPLWTIGRVCLWPHALFTGNHFEWRVPIDDEHTLSVGWFYERVPNDLVPYEQGTIPYWTSPIKDPETGRWITSHIMNQDFVAWVGQGTFADRSQERLGESDRGIIMMRQRMQEQARVVADGGVPKAVLHPDQDGEVVTLPIIGRKQLVDGYTLEELEQGGVPAALGPREFPFLYGQPPEVRDAYRRAMGLDRTESR